MLVTDVAWAECNASKRRLVTPYQAWDCVGWTDETMNFLVIASPNRRGDAFLPTGWLLAGPDALLEAVSEGEQDDFLVYVLDHAADGAGLHLHQVAGIWRERETNAGDEPWRWYLTNHSELRPCTQMRRSLASPPELVNERIFGTAIVADDRDA